MPVYPHQRDKMQPDMEYAVYEDGPQGKSVLYYSVTGNRTVHGAEADTHRKQLEKAWNKVKSDFSQEGTFHYFEHRKA